MSRVIEILVCVGILLGGVDEIRGNKKGYGGKFREAFELIPSMAFSMVGMICLTNFIAFVLEKGLAPLLKMLRMDPAVLAGFLAVDMGGYQLAEKLAVNPTMGSYAGIVLGAGLGCTLVFTIPVGMGMVEEENKSYFAKGIVLGLLGLPFALAIGGLLSGLTVRAILWENILPMSIAAICGIGLAKFSVITMKIFGAYVKVLRVILMVGLMLGAMAHTLHISEQLGMTPVLEAMGVVCSISVFLLGSLPITMLLQKILQRPFTWLGRKLGLDSVSMTGFLITCVSPLPTLALMKDMNPKGKLWNVAFMVSGASAIGAHLAFVNSVEPKMTGALLGSKLLGGLLTVGLACLIGKIDDDARRKEYGHSYQDSEIRRL